MLDRSIGMAEPFGLLLVDIDHLKLVNDTVGHVFGDRLIGAVAARIADCHPSLTACRLGGDEFAVLVADCR
ncbi:diguanylate cyclase domain-containing protein [Devosia ginsengisoli]|uniref:Diguanylate cyclase n=1 Tax=Devosia ginsengisoli TaxID=400770 RepID=A0A5B8LM23_9HYPH|nr:diguanylate cyclase [Devosia ginsengisoli]QDZ09297.1 diguanylate cyclase [Devosia ginsengisoli]